MVRLIVFGLAFFVFMNSNGTLVANCSENKDAEDLFVLAQAPKMMNYQGAARDAKGKILVQDLSTNGFWPKHHQAFHCAAISSQNLVKNLMAFHLFHSIKMKSEIVDKRTK